jgi:hypothetical protein
VGTDLVVFGLAAMDRHHVERMAQDKGNALLGAEVGEPIPGEGGLNQYQSAAADRLQPPLVPRSSFRRRLMPGVRLTCVREKVKSDL